MDRLRRFGASSAVAALMAFLAFEGTVRLDDWARFAVPMHSPEIQLSDLSIRDSTGFHARPGARYRQFRINSLGFRGPELNADSVRGPIVFTAGASETFGLYESPGHEWPRQLQDSLAGCEPQPRVLNSAFAGMTLPTVQEDFVKRLRTMAPALVIYYPTPMQYLTTPLPTAAPPWFGPIAPLSPYRSRAIPRLRDALKRGLPDFVLDRARQALTERSRRQAGLSVSVRASDSLLLRFERDLRVFAGNVRASGSSLALVVHANRFRDTTSTAERRYLRAWERFYPEHSGAAILRFDADAALRTVAVAQDSGLLVVDPRLKLRSLDAPTFADFTHLNDDGAGVVAGEVARVVRPLLCQ